MEQREYSFERMTEKDADAFLAIEQQTVTPRLFITFTKPEEALEEIREHELFFIKKGGVTVGTVAYQIQPDGAAYISNMSVVPEYRGQGIARAAMKFALAQVQEASRIWLVVHPENVPALKLYESLSFKIESRKENYYGDGEPRVVMAKG